MPPGTFDDSVIEAVAAHMNTDHAEDCLLIARELGPARAATEARVVSLDADGVDFLASDGADRWIVRVAFDAPVRERADLRSTFVRLHDAAVAARDGARNDSDNVSESD